MAMEPQRALQLLSEAGFLTVDFEVVYQPSVLSEEKKKQLDALSLDSIFRLSRCMNNEGSVLYCTNVETGESVLFKSKSVV